MNLNTDINTNTNRNTNTEMQIYANRCIAITKNNKKCRAKVNNLKNNYKFFCCEGHLPVNKEIIQNGCFMCMEKIEKSTEIIYFKCKHLFHKPCYFEWLTYSTYETPICLICREVVIVNKNDYLLVKRYKEIDFDLVEPIINIKNTFNKFLNNCNIINCKKCTKTYMNDYVNSSLFCEKLLLIYKE